MSPMTLAPGQTLGRYRIVRSLGSGGMGQVFLARDPRLDREVALKVLPPELAGDAEALRRLEREARAVAALNHPNIVTLYSVEDADGLRFLTMELVDGRTLAGLIPASGLSVRRTLEIGAAVADALAAAHEKGIAHRDLKPGNVMIDSDGRVKVLDFGLARRQTVAGGTTTLATASETIAGTIGYMAPEQLKGEAADPRADLFAIGVLLYEMLAGAPPFRGGSSPEIASSILRDTPEPILRVRSDVPARLSRIIVRCLEKDPRKRMQSAADLRDELRDVAQDLAAAAQPGLPASRRTRRRYELVSIAVALLFVIAAVGVVLMRRGSPMSGPPRIQSLAVLPFDNLMKDPAQDYFVDGLHDSVLTELAGTAGVRVISRTSVLAYRGERKSVPEIARELHVDGIIEGSVLKAGDRVRINAQLIRASDDRHLWARSYDREVGDVIGLISDVSAAIATEVGATVSAEAASASSAGRRRLRPEASDAIFRGRHAAGDVWSDERTRLALTYYEQAIALDPEAAEGWARIASVRAVRAFFGFAPADEEMPVARKAAERALQLDPQNAIATSTLGTIALYFDWDWPRAKPLLEKGILLGPTDMMIRHAYADYWMITGNHEESLRQVQLGLSYDPLSPTAYIVTVFHMVAARRYADAEELARRMVAMFPDVRAVQTSASDVFWTTGRYDEALRALAASERSVPPELQTAAFVQRAYREQGPRAAMKTLAAWLAAHPPQAPMTLAGYYARAGDADATFQWLDRALQQRRPALLHITAIPSFDFIRTDPRYTALLDRIGLPKTAP